MRNATVFFVASVLAATAPASAQTIGFNGTDAIARGDYDQAEQVIDRTRKMFPELPELMLNLALVYRHTARPDQARALYREVLRRPDTEMDASVRGETVSAHAVAAAGLASMEQRIASR